MPPAYKQPHAFNKDEKILCYHGPHLYEAKVLELEPEKPEEPKGAWQYYVHYMGWKATWDSWVAESRCLKATTENKELADNLKTQARQEQRDRDAEKKRNSMKRSDRASLRDSEERSVSAQAGSRGTKRGRDYEIEKEESFKAKPAIKIPLPDQLKSLLVDDWENVTRHMSLVPLPHPKPVITVLNDYYDKAVQKRAPGHEQDSLLEIKQGLIGYFDKALPRILLYKLERQQWLDLQERMLGEKRPKQDIDSVADALDYGAAETDITGFRPCQIYGAEHLARLFCSLPELLAQTNMEANAVERLRVELTKMSSWLSRNAREYFVDTYYHPGDGYIAEVKALDWDAVKPPDNRKRRRTSASD